MAAVVAMSSTASSETPSVRGREVLALRQRVDNEVCVFRASGFFLGCGAAGTGRPNGASCLPSNRSISDSPSSCAERLHASTNAAAEASKASSSARTFASVLASAAMTWWCHGKVVAFALGHEIVRACLLSVLPPHLGCRIH